uniref:Uncharacterized protein n=1 Tax=Cucumis sativus TaxID=3659 RepID=A0A0A0KAJ2_CUCSA
MISEGWVFWIGVREDGVVSTDRRGSLDAGAANSLVEGIGERGIAKDEFVRGRVVILVAVDPGEGAAEVEVEGGWAEGSFEVEGDGVEERGMVFVERSNESCLKRIQRK